MLRTIVRNTVGLALCASALPAQQMASVSAAAMQAGVAPARATGVMAPVTVSLRNVPLEQALLAIVSQVGLKPMFGSDVRDAGIRVTVNVRQQPAAVAL